MEERYQNCRHSIAISLKDQIQEVMIDMNVTTLRRLRNNLEEVVQEEEARYGIRSGLEHSDVNKVSEMLFLFTSFIGRSPFYPFGPLDRLVQIIYDGN